MSRAAAIVPAAGRGARLGLRTPKAFVDLCGAALLARTLAAVCASRRIALVLPVVPRAHLTLFRARVPAPLRERCLPPVAGGRERQDSVAAGLRALPAGVEFVVIHDGARPFVTAALLDRVLAEARRHGAAIAAVPVQDTVKRATPDLFLDGTLDRRGLWLAQTPQAFHASLLREAHERAREEGRDATDDAALVEALGHRVRVVPGSRLNFKITTREDLAVARALVAAAGRKRVPA